MCACVSTDLPPLHSVQAPFELEEDEVRMWQGARDEAVRLDEGAVEDPDLQALLDGIVTELLGSDAAKLKTTPRVRMLTDSEVNAFALPEGSIYVFSGLLTTLASEDQLAAVLSHEIAHYPIATRCARSDRRSTTAGASRRSRRRRAWP